MKILFICHEGTRTGAPFVLLHLLEWLKNEYSSIDFDVLIFNDGELVPEFRKHVRKLILMHHKPPNTLQKIKARLTSIPFERRTEIEVIKRIKKDEYDLIYANSIATLETAIILKKQLQLPLILHVHELKLNLKMYAPDFIQEVKFVDQIICASKAVQNNLIDYYGVAKHKTSLVYEFINQDYLFKQLKSNTPQDSSKITISASGTLNWRKNPDSFIQIALLLKKRKLTNFQFIWVGAYDDMSLTIYQEDIKKAGLEDCVKIIGKIEHPFSLFNQSKLFLMTSKEDPFPLVCIEAGLLGKPIICFENAGGIPEMLENGGGKVVPYLDNYAMAEAVLFYLSNEKQYNIDSEKIKQQCSQYTVEKQGPKIVEVIEEVLSN